MRGEYNVPCDGPKWFALGYMHHGSQHTSTAAVKWTLSLYTVTSRDFPLGLDLVALFFFFFFFFLAFLLSILLFNSPF